MLVDFPRYCIFWRCPAPLLHQLRASPGLHYWRKDAVILLLLSPLLLPMDRVKSREGEKIWKTWKYSNCNKFSHSSIALWSKNHKIERRMFRALHVADSTREINLQAAYFPSLFLWRKMTVIVTLFKLICVYL